MGKREDKKKDKQVLISDNNRDGLAEPYRSSLNDNANVERSTKDEQLRMKWFLLWRLSSLLWCAL
jgi:hypothetical protein